MTIPETVEMAEAVLRSGGDLTSPDKTGKTPLHYACLSGNLDLVEYLLTLGVPVDIRDSEHSQVPLHFAAKMGHVDCTSLLLQVGVDAELADKLGWTAVHHAVAETHINVVKVLIANGASLCIQSESGLTPLHLATTRGSLDMVKLVLENCKALVSIEDNQGQTALHYACKFGFEDIGELLLASGVDTTVVDDKGWSALHLAANGGFARITYLLLQSGAIPNKLTKQGSAPVHLCLENYLKVKKDGDEAMIDRYKETLINLIDNGGRISLTDVNGVSVYDRLTEMNEKEFLSTLQQHRRNYKKTISKRSKVAPPWTPDDVVDQCQLNCGVNFSIFNRKHHCRSCGKCVCHSCSNHRVALPSLGFFSPVRVCKTCYSEQN
ncbi:hypothetical protein P9112_007508 [Eukaryota sp. TZLM1-RC]